VILYFHGGAFCCCSSQSHRALAFRLVEYTGATVLVIDYDKPPQHPWPKPVQDCLDAYRWLLQSGVDPKRIIFAGDSAGGGLVTAVMAAARGHGLPLPAGGIMISPWLELSDSTSGTWTSNQEYDYLPRDWADMFARAYAGDRDLSQVSPGNVDLVGLPPLLIMVGECECLHDQVVDFAHRADCAHVECELHIAPGMVHVYPLFYSLSHRGSEAEKAFIYIHDFVNKRLGERALSPEDQALFDAVESLEKDWGNGHKQAEVTLTKLGYNCLKRNGQQFRFDLGQLLNGLFCSCLVFILVVVVVVTLVELNE